VKSGRPAKTGRPVKEQRPPGIFIQVPSYRTASALIDGEPAVVTESVEVVVSVEERKLGS
jgi:hypothetical protein